MKNIVLATIIVSLLIIIITGILEKIIKNKYKGKIYIRVYYFILYSSVVTMILSTSYYITDTLLDFIRVVGLFLVCSIAAELHDRYIKGKKYDWAVLLVGIFVIYGCYVLSLRYMLYEYNMNGIFGAVGGIIGSNLKSSATNKKKVIIGSILSLIIIATISFHFEKELFNLSKPIRIAINEAKVRGYDINDNAYIMRPLEKNRFEPINIYIIRVKDKYKTQHIQIKYYKEKIIEFNVQ